MDITLSDIKTQIVKLTQNNIIPPAVLVHGAPGTGKTTTAKELATQINAELLVVQCSRWNQDTSKQIRDFCLASNGSLHFFGIRPRMVLLDEIEQFGNGQDQIRPILDDFGEKVFFFATTNYIDRVNEGVLNRFLVTEIKSESHRQQALRARLGL